MTASATIELRPNTKYVFRKPDLQHLRRQVKWARSAVNFPPRQPTPVVMLITDGNPDEYRTAAHHLNVRLIESSLAGIEDTLKQNRLGNDKGQRPISLYLTPNVSEEDLNRRLEEIGAEPAQQCLNPFEDGLDVAELKAMYLEIEMVMAKVKRPSPKKILYKGSPNTRIRNMLTHLPYAVQSGKPDLAIYVPRELEHIARDLPVTMREGSDYKEQVRELEKIAREQGKNVWELDTKLTEPILGRDGLEKAYAERAMDLSQFGAYVGDKVRNLENKLGIPVIGPHLGQPAAARAAGPYRSFDPTLASYVRAAHIQETLDDLRKEPIPRI